MTLIMYRAQLSSRAGGSTRVAVVDSCSVDAWRPRPEGGADVSGVVGFDPAPRLLPGEFGLVSSVRDPQRDAMARERTFRRNSCDWRMSMPRNPALSICYETLEIMSRIAS